MARTVNAQDYALKRAEILDVTWRLLYRKGYEQLTISDILGELKISKGAFYHYFRSKPELLEALLEQLGQQSHALFDEIMREPATPTLSRLQRYLDSLGRWKVAQKATFLALLRSWYADENAIVRLRVQEWASAHTAPRLSRLIAQGVAEGELSTAYPDMAGGFVLAMLIGVGDAFARMLLAPAPQPDALAAAERLVAAYNDGLERVLGARPGSIHLIDAATTREWFEAGGIL